MTRRSKYPDGIPGPSVEASKALLAWSCSLDDYAQWKFGFKHLSKQALNPTPWHTGGENMEWLRQHCYGIVLRKNPDELKLQAQAILDWIHGNWTRSCTDVYVLRKVGA